MKLKRCIFIGSLLVVFLSCFYIMSQSYDELSRYQYTNENNRSLILKYLDDEEVNILIDRQYKPEEFIDYITIKGFDIRLVDWYNTAVKPDNISDAVMIQLVNELAKEMTYFEFEMNCQNFTITQLYDFFNAHSMNYNQIIDLGGVL